MVVFHHIIRTGGMAVIANIAHCNPQLTAVRRDAPFNAERMEPYPDSLCGFLHGHFAYEKIPSSSVRFTFARHPIARLCSSFYALKRVLRGFHMGSIKDLRAPALNLTFAGGISLSFRKEQLLFLERIEGFIDMFLSTRGTFNLNFIPEIFVPDYSKDYDFIGITERMNESIVKLAKLIPTDASRMAVVNASDPRPIGYRLKELREFYGEEIEAYRKVCDRFHS